ncbi:MAG: hypothetical protein IEMM0006_1741 [bacterium]|nr:MAG: hypothetical protein IEMM0006_1741 [bacterium]
MFYMRRIIVAQHRANSKSETENEPLPVRFNEILLTNKDKVASPKG